MQSVTAPSLQIPRINRPQPKNLAVSGQILPTHGALANADGLLCTQWHQIRYIGGPNVNANAEKDFAE
jgi:hypothetical protein